MQVQYCALCVGEIREMTKIRIADYFLSNKLGLMSTMYQKNITINTRNV